ncbi:MAG: lipoate--protein ligase family protein [Elusimicrobia bacterium]|nr:lipoate--protein ligase family protein [Elusimicrobiota bacterium]
MLGSQLTARLVLDAAGHMALDEAVLLESPPDALVLRVYEWAGEACTFGFSQRYEDAKAACKKGVEPVRRATGGGIVHHDGDVTFSLVFPWDRSCAPETIYKNIHRGIHQALKARGTVNGMWSPREKAPGIAASCFARAEKADLVDADDRKILGGALRKKGVKGLYQGSLRVRVPEAVILDGITREFGRPSTEILPSWIEAGKALEARYRSAEWNARR